jgi:outer membrane biosynthesis protein TonB
MLLVLLGVGSCLGAVSCAKAQAKAAPEGPPLSVPAAPPRVLAPVDSEPLAENPPAPEPVATPTPPRTNARPAAPPRRPTTTTTTTEPEPKSEPAPPPAPAPAAETPPAAPRPATVAVDAAAEKRVRDQLKKATADLNRVDYKKLSADGKAQYEQSKRFNDQAEQALKDRDYVFASTLATKAAALATELLGR